MLCIVSNLVYFTESLACVNNDVKEHQTDATDYIIAILDFKTFSNLLEQLQN